MVYRRVLLFAFITILSFLYGYVAYNFLTTPFVLCVVFGLVLGAYLALLDWHLETYSVESLLGGSLGGVGGLFVAYIILAVFENLPVEPNNPLALTLLGVFGYLGVYIGSTVAQKWPDTPTVTPQPQAQAPAQSSSVSLPRKVLDTSVIIDGRVAGVIEIGFLEGVFVVPRFILKELQNMADSGNKLKRNRGRRGLDILNTIRDDLPVEVDIVEMEFPEIDEVDAKLVACAKEMDAKVLTNDFNLNKVASLQDVEVLNINELSNAVKPVYIPGESFEIELVKEGEEEGQGVGYLEDGTMVVVENGSSFLNEEVPVTVTSVIQTSAGRMIFAEKGEKTDIS
ncbi:MAG: PIN/TRAM domain-containing protein [bacterium]